MNLTINDRISLKSGEKESYSFTVPKNNYYIYVKVIPDMDVRRLAITFYKGKYCGSYS